MHRADAPPEGRPRAAFSCLRTAAATRAFTVFGAAAGLLGVMGGALGSHALRHALAAENLARIATAIDYQMYHALALLALAALQRGGRPSAWFGAAALCFCVGIVLFCGSLWAIALSGTRAYGVLAPFGGTLLMAGWALLIAGALRRDE